MFLFFFTNHESLGWCGQEFKLNPNAKSFKPSQPAGARPQSPIADSSFYYPAGPVQQMPGMPVGYGVSCLCLFTA